MLALFGSASACRAVPAPRPAPETRTLAAREEARPGVLREGVERCTAIAPGRLPSALRPFARLVSASAPLPWSLGLDVELYQRAELLDAQGRRTVVEALRLRGASRPAIVAELGRALARPVAWDAEAARATCAGEPTCTPLRARFLDPATVLLVQGPADTSAGEALAEPCAALLGDACAPACTSSFEAGCAARADPCSGLLAREPRAFEASLRMSQATGPVRGSEVVLAYRDDGFARLSRKRYADPGSAERAQRGALTGHDELPLFAGVAARSFGERRGALVEQTSFVSLEELALARADEARQTLPTRIEQVDPRDTARVRALYDAHAGPERVAELDALLTRARAHAERDEGLLRRHYELKLAALDDAAAALAIAEHALRSGLGDAAAWELRLRAALARRADERALADELASAHGLPRELASRMARELVHKIVLDPRTVLGSDYERAEWAFLLAQRLAGDVKRLPRVPLALTVPIAQLARVFAYLAQGSEAAGEIGVHVLVLGASARREPPASAGAALGNLERGTSNFASWLETGGAGRAARVAAATGWDDARLLALGRELASEPEDGPLEVWIGLERLGAKGRIALALSGRRVGSSFVVERASRPLPSLRWPAIERLLLAPLAKLSNATYPPDALVVLAADEQEALRVVEAAERTPRVACTQEGAAVQCRGPLTEARAAEHALLGTVRALLALDARKLWTAGD